MDICTVIKTGQVAAHSKFVRTTAGTKTGQDHFT